jgi:hypothetical protein
VENITVLVVLVVLVAVALLKRIVLVELELMVLEAVAEGAVITHPQSDLVAAAVMES